MTNVLIKLRYLTVRGRFNSYYACLDAETMSLASGILQSQLDLASMDVCRCRAAATAQRSKTNAVDYDEPGSAHDKDD